MTQDTAASQKSSPISRRRPVRGCGSLSTVQRPGPTSDRDGSLDALRSLDPDAYHELRPSIWRFARSRLAADDQAEDVVSEAMVRAMSAIDRYRDGASGVHGWIVGIARNVVNETYRSGSRARAVDPSAPVALTAEPADRIVAEEEAHALRAAFAQLPEPDRELLGLRVLARLDAETTAKVLGKRPGAVRMAQSRALGRLRAQLSERLA